MSSRQEPDEIDYFEDVSQHEDETLFIPVSESAPDSWTAFYSGILIGLAGGGLMTLGNLSENPNAFIFLMDYAKRQRVKLWGTATVVEDDAELLDRLRDPDYPGKVERAIVFTVEAWDINCPQHIHKRFSQREVRPVIEELQRRISELEAQLAEREAREPRSLSA